MPNDDAPKTKTSVNVSVGKQIDAALGEVIRGLLKKPSEEAGNLLADGIGILGDRIKQKRHLNAQLGLEETRAILDSKDVQLKDITPPAEEDLHLLVDGMSVAADDKVRRLWSGLMASALNPEEAQSVDRPIISAISALSPADARVIEYGAYVSNTSRSIHEDAKAAAGVINKRWLTYGDINRIEEERLAMKARLAEFMEKTLLMEKESNLAEISANSDWSDNLSRLGLIRPRPEEYNSNAHAPSINRMEVDARDFSELLKFIEERIAETESLALEGLEIEYLSKRDEEKQQVYLGFELTRFGENLCRACGLS